MDLEALQEELSKILPPGFMIETSESGELIVFTNLIEKDDLLLTMSDDDFVNDLDKLEEDDYTEEDNF